MPDLGAGGSSSGGGLPLRNIVLFAAVCVLSVAFAAVYVVRSASGSSGPPRDSAADAPQLALADVLKPTESLVFLDTVDIADPNRAIAHLPGDPAGGGRQVSGEACQRVAMAAGRGLCLTLGHDLSRGSAFIFDDAYKVVHIVPATGLPSRARVSPDGRYGSMTFFIFGHAYSGGAFSTRTDIVDMASGHIVNQLEDFTTEKDGRNFESPDFNFWGISFAADSNHFYATLGSGGHTYLVDGDVAAHHLRVLKENVECPSLSPDGTRIAYKKRVSEEQGKEWRLTLLDLATMTEHLLPETRSVDDQVEWLDNQRILYSPPTQSPEIWVLPVDGSGPPARFLGHAFSPSVQR